MSHDCDDAASEPFQMSVDDLFRLVYEGALRNSNSVLQTESAPHIVCERRGQREHKVDRMARSRGPLFESARRYIG